MTCTVCGGTTSPKTITWKGQPKLVFECNQDNGDCLNEKGYPNSVWPRQGGGGGGTRSVQPSSPAPRQDDRSNRIERQHSQHMALLYIQAKEQDFTFEDVRKLTDAFQRDIGRSPDKKQVSPENEPYEPDDRDGYQDQETPF